MIDGSGTAETVMLRDDPSALTVAAAPPEAALDRLVGLAADLFGATAAGLARVRGDRMEVLSSRGLEGARRDWPLAPPLSDPASCLVRDTKRDGLLRHHALVTEPPYARFLVSAPILSADGAVQAILFVIDRSARPIPAPGAVNRLEMLAAIARDALDGRSALERAEAATDAKSRLLADVSHELRTPLNGIMGFLQLLKRDASLDEPALRNVERIEEAGRGLLSIVNDALDLSKIESGMVRLEMRPFSALRLIEDSVAMVRPDVDRKGLALTVDLPAVPPPLVLGDADRLRQVLLNLLSNAVKFTNSGSVRVSLAARETGEAPGDIALSFAVEDSGVGIASDGIPRLFNRFVQADRNVAPRFGGTGLGLAISKTLIEAMGGSIEVVSSPGVGARFSVGLTLPRAVETEASGPVVEPERLPGLAILLAEDAPMNQRLVTQMLAPLVATIDVVADGAAAVAAAARRDYALVLMDMEMPVMGGLDATRRIRALPGPAGSVPIVALTANVYPEQLDLCRAAGMDDCVTKPFGPDDLIAVALRWARRLKPAG